MMLTDERIIIRPISITQATQLNWIEVDITSSIFRKAEVVSNKPNNLIIAQMDVRHLEAALLAISNFRDSTVSIKLAKSMAEGEKQVYLEFKCTTPHELGDSWTFIKAVPI